MGLPCAFAVARKAGSKTDNAEVAELTASTPPMVMFGSFNERMYMAEAGARGKFIQLSYPGAIVRRHTGTPVMGYSGACWLIQEVCNALFDMLFEILPMASELDAIEATAAKANSQMPWHPDAQAALERRVNQEPVLVRISAAKRLRERAEQRARQNKASEVTLDDLEQVSGREGAPA
jgi:chlorophyllide a reductase subunit Z